MHFVVTVAVAVVFVVIGGAVAVLLLMMWLIHIACLHCFQACSITLLVLFWIRAEWWKKTIHFAWRNLEKLFLDKSIQFEYDLFRLLKAKNTTCWILLIHKRGSMSSVKASCLSNSIFHLDYFFSITIQISRNCNFYSLDIGRWSFYSQQVLFHDSMIILFTYLLYHWI